MLSILPSAFKNSDDDPPIFLKLPAVNCPVVALNLRDVFVCGVWLFVGAPQNTGKHSVSPDSSVKFKLVVVDDDDAVITPLLIVIVLPSIFTPPRTVVVAVGKL